MTKTTFNKIVRDMTDEEYHEQMPLEEHFFSSSQVKGAYKNAFKFHREVVGGKKAAYGPATLDAFTVGHYFHTFFLEPHKMEEYVTYEGRRAGKVWADFQEENAGKRILSPTMKEQADTLVQGVQESEPSMNVLQRSFETEISMFSVMKDIRVKCRFDLLHENFAHIEGMELLNKGADLLDLNVGGDLKSTNESDIEDEDTLRKIIKQYGYDISFAFYKDIYESVTGKSLDAWYWIIASKKFPRAKLVWATEEYYQLGRSKYTKGMEKMLELIADNWEFKDKALTLGPAGYELSSVMKELQDEEDL